MSIGLFTGLLHQTAVVYRRQQEGGSDKVDRFGQPTRDEEFSHLISCRYTPPRGGTRFEERSHDVVESRGTLFIEKESDILEKDVVTVLDANYENVKSEADSDPSGFVSSFHITTEKAEVDLAVRVADRSAEHHREIKLISQSGSGEPR